MVMVGGSGGRPPKKDGHEVPAATRHDEVLRRVRAVALTVTSDHGNIGAANDLSACCDTAKPVDLDAFVRALNGIVDSRLTMRLPPE